MPPVGNHHTTGRRTARNTTCDRTAQFAAPQSAHVATARLLHGLPMSPSLLTCSIWQWVFILPLMPEESEVESCEHHDDANIHCQPFRESVCEENKIHNNYDAHCSYPKN
jgi:hypothetical protein